MGAQYDKIKQKIRETNAVIAVDTFLNLYYRTQLRIDLDTLNNSKPAASVDVINHMHQTVFDTLGNAGIMTILDDGSGMLNGYHIKRDIAGNVSQNKKDFLNSYETYLSKYLNCSLDSNSENFIYSGKIKRESFFTLEPEWDTFCQKISLQYAPKDINMVLA